MGNKNLETESFSERVYSICRKIPKGRISTYKEIANALNCKAYRAVGSALHKNPYAPIVPCHRVVNSNGYIGGFAGGVNTKIKILKREGVPVKNNKIVNFNKLFYTIQN